jgi:hypothetical protein
MKILLIQFYDPFFPLAYHTLSMLINTHGHHHHSYSVSHCVDLPEFTKMMLVDGHSGVYNVVLLESYLLS